MLANPFGAVAAAIGLVVAARHCMLNATRAAEGSSKVDDLKTSLGGLELTGTAGGTHRRGA
jgi:hypothetical protein